jgi:hypothetical protein
MQPQDDEAPQMPAPQPEERAQTPSEPAHSGSPEAGRPGTPAAAEGETPAPAKTPAAPAAAGVAKRPPIPMAAFERVPTRWLIVAGGVVALVVVALGAVLLFGGGSGRSTTGAPVQAAPGASAPPSGPGGGSAPDSPGPSRSFNGPGGASGGTAAGGATQPGPAGVPPASVDALKALLIPAPGTDSTVDTEPIADTTFEGARWGVTMFWANPEGSMVLAQYGTADEARTAISQYRDSVHQSGICDEQAVAGRADAFLCAAKGLGDGVKPGDIPAIGLGLKGTVVALVTASDPNNVQQLLVTQLDRLP